MKDMVVIDLWNAGEQRPVETLIRRRVISGQPVAGPGTSQNFSSGRSRLESLFLDGGFGTPDSDTLDAALNALESRGYLARPLV